MASKTAGFVSGLAGGLQAGIGINQRQQQIGLQQQELGQRAKREERFGRQAEAQLEQGQRRLELNEKQEARLNKQFDNAIKASADKTQKDTNFRFWNAIEAVTNPDVGNGLQDVSLIPTDVILKDFQQTTEGKGAESIRFDENGNMLVTFKGDKEELPFDRARIEFNQRFYNPTTTGKALTPLQARQETRAEAGETRAVAGEKRDIEEFERKKTERGEEREDKASETIQKKIDGIEDQISKRRQQLLSRVPLPDVEKAAIDSELERLRTQKQQAERKLLKRERAREEFGTGGVRGGLEAGRKREKALTESEEFKTASDVNLPLAERKRALSRAQGEDPSQIATPLLAAPSPGKSKPTATESGLAAGALAAGALSTGAEIDEPVEGESGVDEAVIASFMKQHQGKTREQVIKAIKNSLSKEQLSTLTGQLRGRK